MFPNSDLDVLKKANLILVIIKSPFNKRICVIIRQIILYCSIFERYNQPYNNARKFIN